MKGLYRLYILGQNRRYVSQNFLLYCYMLFTMLSSIISLKSYQNVCFCALSKHGLQAILIRISSCRDVINQIPFRTVILKTTQKHNTLSEITLIPVLAIYLNFKYQLSFNASSKENNSRMLYRISVIVDIFLSVINL